MLSFEVHLEDSHFTAVGGKGGWKINLWDSFNGKAETRVWSTKQLSAVLALACGLGEEYQPCPPMLISHLYKLAESAVVGLNDALRPIP